jgi:hypothetical protein
VSFPLATSEIRRLLAEYGSPEDRERFGTQEH